MVKGVEGGTFGYLTRERILSRIVRKEWTLRDYGSETVAVAAESWGRSLLRRCAGRLAGRKGAFFWLREKGHRAGFMESKGFWRRELEMELAPSKSRLLLQMDPRVLLALAALLLVRDRDAEHPWPLP